MMRRNVDTTLTARVCQVASLLLFLAILLCVLVQDIMRNADRVDANPARGDIPVGWCSCPSSQSASTAGSRSVS